MCTAESYFSDRSQTAICQPLNEALSRLQRMLLKRTKYDLEVCFVPGKQ